jgi:hypothetical protein
MMLRLDPAKRTRLWDCFWRAGSRRFAGARESVRHYPIVCAMLASGDMRKSVARSFRFDANLGSLGVRSGRQTDKY